VERDPLWQPGGPGVEIVEDVDVALLGDGQTVDGHAVDVRRAGGIRVGPRRVVDRTGRQSLDMVTPGGQPGGELPAMAFRPAGHLMTVALGHEQHPGHHATPAR
jgi:hypothetical protein